MEAAGLGAPAPKRSVGRRLADLFHGRPRLQVGSLLAGPVAWLVVGYLGSLARRNAAGDVARGLYAHMRSLGYKLPEEGTALAQLGLFAHGVLQLRRAERLLFHQQLVHAAAELPVRDRLARQKQAQHRVVLGAHRQEQEHAELVMHLADHLDVPL